MKENTTYLVMEVHTAYAVLLDNEGRFIKAANVGYQIGDIVERAFPLKYPEDRKKRVNRVIRLAASLAACICVAVFGVYEYQYFFLPYGTIQMQINPDIEMTLSRSGRVLDLDGINEDGKTLIDGYDYDGKDKYTVTDELTDRAIDLGFLDDGGQVALLVTSKNTEWADTLEKDLVDELNEHLKQYDLTINVSVGTIDADVLDEPQSITIPIPDPEPAPAPEPAAEPEPAQPVTGDSGYDDDAADDLYDDAGDDTDDGDSSYGDDDWDDGDDSGEDDDD
ncbi:MAG: hypothetical protein ACLROY_07745 [Mediterraneibacter sp.]|jgi:hypothetical protein